MLTNTAKSILNVLYSRMLDSYCCTYLTTIFWLSFLFYRFHSKCQYYYYNSMILWFKFQHCTIMQSLQTCLNRKIVIKITNDNIITLGIYHNTYIDQESIILGILFYKQLIIKPLILLSFFHLNPTEKIPICTETLLLAFLMHNILYWGV